MSFSQKVLLSILILFFYALGQIQAEPIVKYVFDEKMTPKQYDQSIEKIKEGDQISLRTKSDGVYNVEVFHIKRILTAPEATTFVAELVDGTILRMPIREDFSVGIENFEKIQKQLNEVGVATPKILKKNVQGNFPFLVVEKVPVEFTLQDFLMSDVERFDELKTKAPRARLINELKVFANSLSFFSEVPDLTDSNIVWDGNRWVALDYGYPYYDDDAGNVNRAKGTQGAYMFSQQRNIFWEGVTEEEWKAIVSEQERARELVLFHWVLNRFAAVCSQ